jgi:hypothetical protein
MRSITGVLAAAGVTALLVGGGVALATSLSTTDDTIMACVKDRGGAMRYVTSDSCRRGETLISWKDGSGGPAQVVWVAREGGDYTKLSTALASITDNSSSKPYVIKIAPGVYTETQMVNLKDFVDVEGSGQGVTTLDCACGSVSAFTGAVVKADGVTAEIRHLTINNSGGSERPASLGVYTYGSGPEFSMLHVTVTAVGGNSNYGVYNLESSPSLNNVTVTAIGGGFGNYGVYNSQSSPSMNNVTATAAQGAQDAMFSNGVHNVDSSPSMNNVTATGGKVGVFNTIKSHPTIRSSSIHGGTYSVEINPLAAPNQSSAKIADTTLNEVVAGSGFTCVGVHNQNFVALNTSCL